MVGGRWPYGGTAVLTNLAVVLVSILLASSGATALAAIGAGRPSEGLPVAIAVNGCPDIPLSIVHRVVTAELHAMVTEERGQTPSPDTTRADVRCDANGLVHLRVADPVTGKTVGRTIDLAAEDPAARPRLLALSIAELIAASWIELTANPSRPPVRSPDVTASAQTRQAVLAVTKTAPASGRPFQPMLRLEFTGAGRTFQSGALNTFGGGVALTRVHREWLTFGGGVVAEHGRKQTPLGTVTALLASAVVQTSLRRNFGRVAIESGLGARVGITQFSGTPEGASVMADRGVLRAAWGGPLLCGQVHVRIWKALSLSVGAEAGYVMRPVVALADRRSALAIDGFWLAGTMGLAFQR